MIKHVKADYLVVVKLFRQLKIRTRLVLLFACLSMVPVIFTVFFTYQQSSFALTNKISTYSVQVMQQVGTNVQRELDRLENDSVDIEFSASVQNLLGKYTQLSEWERMGITHAAREDLGKKFSFLHDVSDVALYTVDRKKITLYGDTGIAFNLRPEILNGYLDDLHEKSGAVVWRPVNGQDEDHLVAYASQEQERKDNGILLGRAVKSLPEGNIIGFLLIRTNERYLSDIYKNIDIGQGSSIFILDSTGRVVSTRSAEIPFKELYPDKNMVSRLMDSSKHGGSVFDYEINGRRYLVSFAPLQGQKWFTLCTIPYTYLEEDAHAVYEGAVLIGLVCFIIAVGLAYLFASGILAPIRRLQAAMNLARKGNLSVKVRDKHQDEIGELTQNFDSMLLEIERLLTNIKNQEKQKRQAELKALQAQINPHFISNTLNTVKFLAKAQKAYNIESLTGSLIQLFHMTVGKGDDLITIAEELEYIRNYVNIQEYRYLNKFVVKYELEPEILQYKIPRLVLQPLVENSLIHGIEPMEGTGTVVIKGFLLNNVIKITVTDNGVGIPPEKTAGSRHRSMNGIGLTNVDERIRMHFGEQYGLAVESFPGVYTTVEITLPAAWQGCEDNA